MASPQACSIWGLEARKTRISTPATHFPKLFFPRSLKADGDALLARGMLFPVGVRFAWMMTLSQSCKYNQLTVEALASPVGIDALAGWPTLFP